MFDPASVTIKAGDSVTFTNNAGFPHNVVFDEDAVPVRAAAASRSEQSAQHGRGTLPLIN